VLRRVRVETVRRQHLTSGNELEAIGRYNKVQIASHAAHRAIAFQYLELRRRAYFEPDATTVAAPGMRNQVDPRWSNVRDDGPCEMGSAERTVSLSVYALVDVEPSPMRTSPWHEGAYCHVR
jgi:hypothetical protein